MTTENRCFRDADQLYEVLDAMLQRAIGQDEIAEAFLAGNFVLCFRYKEPEGQLTIDLRKAPITWEFGVSDLKADLTMIQSADIAHQFWLGRLNVARAIATRKVVSRGPVSKALKLLPAVKPVFPIYGSVLKDLGYQHLLPVEQEKRTTPWWERFSQVLGKLGDVIPTSWEGLIGKGRPQGPDLATLNEHHIPLVDEVPADTLVYRDQQLPQQEQELKVAMLERMFLIRHFEQTISAANARGDVPTEAIHLSIGQEAVAVGVCFALKADDYIATTHRGHGHMLAKGANLDGMMAEILAKAGGLCGGKGGSMHVTEAAVGAIGANGIVGSSPLMAVGAAHSARYRGTKQVAVAFLGDGATNQGMFHEALNFASVFDLPALFVIENNLYGEFTPVDRHCKVERLADRAAAYGMPGETVDGNDVWAVHEATKRALDRARRGEGPSLLECLTYRWHGHMEGEALPYRTKKEIDQWKKKCPIKRWRASLVEEKLLSKAEASKLDKDVGRTVNTAFEQAFAGPDPAPETLMTDMYAPDAANLYAPTQIVPTDRETSCSQALLEAISEEMERDERVYLLGEDVATGGYFAVTVGLVEQFGTDRIVDTPISEYAIVGSAVGAAMTGMRPVAEILFSDFITTCMDPLVNNAAKLRYMSGGQYKMPLVVRTPGGAGLGMAAQHSQSLEALLTGVPGLIVVAPATPYDSKGMLKAAIRSNNPVLFFENKLLYTATGPVPLEDYIVPLGLADVKRLGTDVTVVSVGAVLARVLDAAEQLSRDGVDVEVVDVRTLVPLDLATIVRSVTKTGRLVTVEDGSLGHGFGSEIVARVVEVAHDVLQAPPKRVASVDVPIPYNTTLENLVVPDTERIVSACRDVVRC